MRSVPMNCTAEFGHGPVVPLGVHGPRARPGELDAYQPALPGDALERARQIGGDPAPVEATRLRDDPLVIDKTGIHAARIERHIARDGAQPGRRAVLAPSGV
jgi:hypothetical protein